MRLFSLCQAMNWAHLPVAGGIYDQHPQLLFEWQVLFRVQNEVEKAKHDKQKAEMEREKAKARRR